MNLNTLWQMAREALETQEAFAVSSRKICRLLGVMSISRQQVREAFAQDEIDDLRMQFHWVTSETEWDIEISRF
jgi:hypothetical protein